MRIVVTVTIVLVVASCATYPSQPVQGSAQPTPGTIRPFVNESMTVGAAVGSSLK